MKKYLIVCLAILSSVLHSCNPDPEPARVDKPKTTFDKMQSVAELLPQQATVFGGNKFPGNREDYEMFFDDTKVSVFEVSPDSIHVLVPPEITTGEKNVKLVYKAQEFDLGKVKILDWKKVLPSSVSFVTTKNSEFPLHITDSISNAIIPHVQNGVVDKIYINGHDGTNSVIELGELGLPSFIYNKDVSIMLDGYDLEKGTVNVAKFSSENLGAAVYEYGIKINPDDLRVLMHARSGRKANADLDKVLTVVGTALSITGCVVSLVPPFTPLGVFGAAIGCGSAIYDVVKILNPDADNKLASTITTVHSIKMSLINCLSLLGKPETPKEIYEGINGCYSLAIEAAKGVNTLYSDYKARLEKDLAMQKAILSSGYGDIKITLDWNSSADIDVWVIDPKGEKIYYNSSTSTSEGQLDLDDTDGFGPENVFWPTDKAPYGKYAVQVHYYGPEDGPSTSYRVVINNFGKSKTFTGTLSYNQVVTIAEFSAGFDWSPSGGRLASIVRTADRSTLPVK